jgi:hypothetical protein
MRHSTLRRQRPLLDALAQSWPRNNPITAVLVVAFAIVVAFSPNILVVSGIHNDYEMLYYRSPGFFHIEAGSLVAIARPVSTLLTNLPLIAVHSLSEFRWTRIFSTLSLCFLAAQMTAICVHQLHTRMWDAAIIVLATFLGYSVLNAPAWVAHLLPVFVCFVSYIVLSQSNIQLLSFIELFARKEYGALLRQVLAYLSLHVVWKACLIYQIAFYDYPPIALILVLFPLVGALFSKAPTGFRTFVALRDLAFVCANVVFFSLTTKLIYFPIVRHFTSLGSPDASPPQGPPFLARMAATYHFDFNLDLVAAWDRLVDILRVSGDLWFLPQANVHVLVGPLAVIAIACANGTTYLARRRRSGRQDMLAGTVVSQLSFVSSSATAWFAIAVPVACIVVAASPVLAASGGFVTYRTVTVPCAIVAIVSIFAIRCVVEALWAGIGSPLVEASKPGDVAIALAAAVACAANFHANYLTMKLARNELAYFTGIIREAVANRSKLIVIVDSRPFMLPEDIPVVYDGKGRSIPPYELGCFSGYCLQTGAIAHIAEAELGHPVDEIAVYSERDSYPVPGLTCQMLTAPTPSYPANASKKSVDLIDWFRTQAPVTCVQYSLDWHDLGYDPATSN